MAAKSRRVRSSATPRVTARATAKRAGAAITSAETQGLAWPIIQNSPDAHALALQFQLEESQWWSPEKLLAHQLRQIQELVDHAARTVPFYRERLRPFAGLPPGGLTLERFRQIPLLPRREIQSAGEDLRCRSLPPIHGTPHPSKTSGSSGRPIEFMTTAMTSLMLSALTMRGHLWHARDLGGKNISLRPPRPASPVGVVNRWAPVARTGPGKLIDMRRPVDELFDELMAEDPDYLQCHPHVLFGLLQRGEETGIRPRRLREVRTYGETLDPWIRQRCEAVWGVPVHDNYSAEEFGTIAHQCPTTTNMHVQAENVLLEVLDDHDAPRRPGETGRAVITSLNNFATPFIRADVGNIVLLGGPCPCGRGLPVLRQIYGKTRNFIVRPTGERVFPDLYGEFAALAPIRQYQLVQTSLDVIEMKLVVTRTLSEAELSGLRTSINRSLGHAFDLPLAYVDDIPRDASGKFRDIHSEVPGAGRL